MNKEIKKPLSKVFWGKGRKGDNNMVLMSQKEHEECYAPEGGEEDLSTQRIKEDPKLQENK